jgi:hypothetical protein
MKELKRTKARKGEKEKKKKKKEFIRTLSTLYCRRRHIQLIYRR